MVKSSKKTIAGWICVGIAFLGIVVSISQGFKKSDVSTIIFFLVVGALLVKAGKKTDKRLTQEYMDGLGQVINDSQTNKNSDIRQVVCTNCGANIQVSAGSGGECEYCGSHVVQG